ncbi:sulfatase [Sphingobacterium mizutaii NBRC 14946 = DSM 11724]|uniref:Lipoteichoic acid synthase 1 n=2 Tax=Sphingobacterium mizutaii TaxID=1010 RepID=A0AAJ4XCS3_9SPHI|nr:alkaline phosphatase family protein [Sphingobacterium mizutaii]GEM68119.1 sulfatase [Sphingobacterium mizutaii NBRC 14946 = DSM 11724]SDL27951.1 Phosphoglycerol transferase MdoB [Sphingobacterium mizutaii]SNV53680.1 Lipoteichoic acid synthase 1 [Sphingobacterium mizutaii]
MIKLKGWFGPYLALAIRLALMLLLYGILRLGFYGFNMAQFPQVSFSELMYMMAGGVKFDIVALLYINILYILLVSFPVPFKYNPLFSKISKWVFVVSNSIGIALNLVDFAYYPFTLKRTTGTVFGQFANEENLGKLFLDFGLEYWYLVFFFVLIVWGLIKLYDLVQVEKPTVFNWKFYSVQLLLLLTVAFLFVGGVRGGWAHSTRPITLSNAGDYVKSPEEMNIVLNTPFSILKTLKAVSLKEEHFFSDQELNAMYPVVHQPKDSAQFKKLNVVLLILESFGKEHIGFFNKDLENGTYKGYTPFLDSLIEQSYTFTRSYANGRKSIDALPSVITGIPSIGEPFVLSIYSGNKTTSLAKLLSDEGYETSFFHGAPNGSMGFSAYMQLAGIKHYYGKNEYNNDADFDGIWGIWDEPFMQYMAKQMDQMKEPFFSSFFSLSSHHPFKVPEKYAGKFPKGTLPLHEPLGYADHALKKFFQTASKSPWYNNTLFVICADHASMSHFKEYNTMPNSFAIPIVFYYPGGELKGVSDKLVQQIDIMPTVLNYLQYDKPYFSFGFDAFAPDRNNFVVSNIGNIYNFFMGDYFMTYGDKEVKSVYNLKADKFLEHDLKGKDLQVQDSLMKHLESFMQQYNNRMIHNKLVAEN